MLRKILVFLRHILIRFTVFVRKPKGLIITGLGVIAFGFLLSATQGNPLEQYDIGKVVRKDVISMVDVTGRIEPADRVNMALERSGKVARINVEVGDKVAQGQILLSAASADLYADLAEAQANLEIERLNLQETSKTSIVDIDSARQDLESEILDAYVEADNAIRNKADQLFYGTDTSKTFGAPIISGGGNSRFSTTFEEAMDLSMERRKITKILDGWRASNLNVQSADIKEATDVAENNLFIIRDFLNNLSFVINSYDADSSSETIVDGYRTAIATARSSISGAISSLRSAEQAYLSAEASSSSEQEGVLQSILLQEQRVNTTQARVNAIWAEINKTLIKAPFNGTITRIDAKVGEIVSSNSPVVSMISDAKFEIETYIPEADIADISLDDKASITLDAYDSNTIFGAYVSFIDPAETIIEGVATYKVLLQFDEEDERVLPGMTANVDIITGTRENVLSIPQRAVIDKDGRKLVRVVRGEETEEVEVEIGLKGFDGDVEVLQGLNEGDEIVVFIRG
ncbi:MAG: hypothetical protein COT89_02900 [Candidatus Colwellbacteria bacterium CG10_big_fil_rev_8_21_14_0_10_42_22]|uniref:Uncharacterized protein n=1 Tax=Candidatus Colwellbacteria bacterium CG10_big_fil_rev_8_21_14_0_10_42_22 TaxID=1974540 RepID=A0A2H0VFE6_9BACT|nr:MAG: hypothetical protein COT89_02900 [Candidatus Colwellbacteria bacterium CG10_big_fil_rev_8_21_14_0_10_42_22]